MKKEFDAILFDFDGTLADTMEDNFSAWEKAFQKYNIHIFREDYFPLEGLALIEIAKNISKKYNLILSDYQELVRLKNENYFLDNKFKFYTGAIELVDLVKKNKLLALVSASPKEKLQKTVPSFFLEYFDVIISGDDVKNGKPSPEPYLLAMKHLSVNPEQCIVVENAPLGIQAAKSAGIYCIAIASTLKKEELTLADEIFENINSFFTYLQNNFFK
jgi:beta-phosphoglucomutase